MSEQTETVRQWAVRFGDGEIDYPYTDQQGAEKAIAAWRADIEAGHNDAEDYEPMELMTRTVTTLTSEWTSTRSGPDAGATQKGDDRG